MKWTAFSQAMPNGSSPILVVHFEEGDAWESQSPSIVDTINRANVDVSEPVQYAHVEVLSVGGNDFGTRLYRDEELSEAEYNALYITGFWMNLTDLLAATRPTDLPFIVNGAAEGESLVT